MAEQVAEEKLFPVEDKDGNVHMLTGINKTDAVNQLGWKAVGSKVTTVSDADKSEEEVVKTEAELKAEEGKKKAELKAEEDKKKAEAKKKADAKAAAANVNGQTGTN